jgi:carotenoid cleavage dioxygenase-like enzyme
VIFAGAWDDSNFFDWFRTELREATDSPLTFEGQVPAYLYGGTFVQTGPARFGWGKMKFTHMLDGYSKTNTLTFSSNGKATYTTKFLDSAFHNESKKSNSIARGMFVGAIEPPPHWGPTAVMGPNDNAYIKMRRIGEQKFILADTMVATEIRSDGVSWKTNVRDKMLGVMVPGVKWDDSLTPLGDMCMLGTMAHGAEDPATGVFTGAMGCFGVSGNYHIVFNIEPSAPTTRKLLAKIHLPHGRSPSYMHCLGSTPNYIILIADVLYMNLVAVLEGKPLGEGSLVTNADKTLFQVVNRKTGAVRILEAPGFVSAHVLNTYEDGDDIVMDANWYASNNATTLGWMNRWFLGNMQNKAVREAWPRSKQVRYRLKADDTVETTLLFADEKGENDFETPKINEKYDGKKYCITYMTQFHSYAYDKDKNSTEAGPFGAVGLAKRNVCTGERSGWYEANMYPSEVQFVPNPSGTAEDDGVLLSMVFDGSTNSSFFQILDARTMKRMAKAPLPIKTPFLIHSSWFPHESRTSEISV